MLSIVSYQIGQILEGLLTKNIGILVHTFYGHLECALYAHLLHIMASLLVIVWSSDAFPPILVYITKKNLATLMRDEKKMRNANFTPDCRVANFFEPVIPDRQKKIPKWNLKIPDF
jgi:hypothetical protein